MKKKIVLCLLLGMMMATLAGCTTEKFMETLADAGVEISEGAKQEDAPEVESEDAPEDEVENISEVESEETEEENKAVTEDIPMLGGEAVEGYEGFHYLYEELLMTDTEENEETGKKERKNLVVYIPDDEYATASGNYAYSSSMGVYFKVELDPYIRYDAEDYLPEENLKEYINNQYDPFYTAEYKDMVISDIESLGNNGVRCTVEYCEYNKWDKAYHTVFATYYLAELENGKNVMVSVEIDDSDITGKTELLVEELEQFYQFDIDWDKNRAEQKRLNYAANETENTYSTGSFMFELPKGWKEDTEVSDYETRVYAPDGDMNFSGCMVTIAEDYLSYDESVDLKAVIDSNTKESLARDFGADITDYSAEICDTGVGKAAKITYTVELEGEVAYGAMYVVATDYDVYTMMAFQLEDATEDALVVLDGIVTTGQMRY